MCVLGTMRRSMPSFAAIVFLLHFRRCCFGVAADPEQQSGGDSIDSTEYSWFVAIRTALDLLFLCNGFLIGSRHVVTAERCVESVRSAVVEVGYRCKKRDNCGMQHDFIGIGNVYRHGSGDFAIVSLDRAIPFKVVPAVPYLGPLWHPFQSQLTDGVEMNLVGAGGRGAGDDAAAANDDEQEVCSNEPAVSSDVKKFSVKYLSPDKCLSKLNDTSLETDIVVCTTVRDGSPCAGGPGAALVVPGQGRFEGRDVVLALQSFGPRTSCSPKKSKNRPSGNFPIAQASNLLRLVICDSQVDAPEDWCEEPPPVSAPTNPPTPAPTVGVKVELNLLYNLTGHTHDVWSTSFNHNGSLLASGSCDNTIKLWDPFGESEHGAISTFTSHRGCVFAVQFHPSYDTFASGGEDQSIQMWNAGVEGEPSDDVQHAHLDTVRSLSWHPSGSQIASASLDNTTKVWDVAPLQLVETINSHKSVVRTVAFHPDGTQVATGSNDETIQLWNTDPYKKKPQRTLKGHTSWVRALAYSPNGKNLASGSADNTAIVWNAKNGKILRVFHHLNDVTSVDWSPDGRFLVTGSWDRTLKIWHALQGDGPTRVEALATVETPGAGVLSVDWSPSGIHIASGSQDDSIKIWNVTVV